jgi:hypothetical protein
MIGGRDGTGPRPAWAVAAGAVLALACAATDPGPLPRIVGALPGGEDVPTTAVARIRFSAPIDPAGLLDGRRLVVAEAADLAAVLDAIEGEEGARGVGLPARAALEGGATAVTLRPETPLRAHLGHVLVLSSRVRAADGRPVLDPEGRHRVFVATFETGAGEGPPPVPVLTEVRAVAEPPAAGGEYVEVANLGAGTLDLRGWRLGKRTGSGALTWCSIQGAASDAIAPGGVGLVVGGAWDGRYALPAGVPVLRCGASALDGGLADDRAPDLVLADPLGDVVATLGEGGAPTCAVALERVAPEGPDEEENLVCTEGSPGTR